MRKEKFINEGIYHIYNRGVDKRVLFLDQADYRRFYESIYLFNDENFCNPGGLSSLGDDGYIEMLLALKPRAPLVKILSFCLMKNHFHLLIQQISEDGTKKFMHRLGMGYAKYFNKRHNRTGRLYEGAFKAVTMNKDRQLFHLPRYIHLNPLDLVDEKWRDGKIEDWVKAKDYLDNYQWSSYSAYIGKEQGRPVVDVLAAKEFFPVNEMHIAYLRDWAGREFVS